jgi:putative ABC transport system permease protein
VSISNIAYIIIYNYRTLACITIVVAATITSIATAFTIPYMFKNLIRVTYPYSFSYTSSNSELKQKVLNTIGSSGHKVNLDIDIKYLPFDSQRGSQYPKNHPVIRLSDFNKIVNSLNASDKYTVIECARKLRDGMAISAVSANDTGFSDNQAINMYGLNVKVIKTMNTPLLGGIFENNTIILADNDYNRFKDYCNKLSAPQKEKSFLGIIVSNQNDSLELSKKLRTIEGFEGFSTYVEYYNAYNEETGVVKFTGMFLGFVFILSTASIMYMKIMSDAIGDKKKYEILMRLGMNKSEIYGAVSKQVGLSYALPLVIGAIYAFMAIDSLQIFLDKYIKMSLVQPFLFGLLIYVVVYIAFYLLTTRKFVDLVEG